MTRSLTTSRDGNLAVIHMDDRRGNALGGAMLRALIEAVAEAASADAILLKGPAGRSGLEWRRHQQLSLPLLRQRRSG